MMDDIEKPLPVIITNIGRNSLAHSYFEQKDAFVQSSSVVADKFVGKMTKTLWFAVLGACLFTILGLLSGYAITEYVIHKDDYTPPADTDDEILRELSTWDLDQLLLEATKNEQYRELVEEHFMRHVYAVDKRLFSFAFDGNGAQERDRVVIEKTGQHKAITTKHVAVLLTEFGRLIRRAHIYCSVAGKNRPAKENALELIRDHVVNIEEITFEQCSTRDLNGWTKPLPSVERITIIGSEFTENKKCKLAAIFPNVRDLTVEAIGAGSLKCIEDEFEKLQQFEFIDHRDDVASRGQEINVFLGKNKHVQSVSLHGAFDTRVLAPSFEQTQRLEVNAATDNFFNGPEIEVPSLQSLIITESDSTSNDLPDRLPFAPRDLKSLTVFRTRITNEWINVIGGFKELSRLSLPMGILSGQQLGDIVHHLSDLQALTIRWEVNNLDAVIEIMNRDSKLAQVSLVGLNIADVVQRKVILRRLGQVWKTVNNKDTVDYITNFARVLDDDDDVVEEEEEDDDQSHEDHDGHEGHDDQSHGDHEGHEGHDHHEES